MDHAVLANLLAPMIVEWAGWQTAWWILAGIAVEIILIKFIFARSWGYAAGLGLLMNLATTLLGLVPMYFGMILIEYSAWLGLVAWALLVLAGAVLSALVHHFIAIPFQPRPDKPIAFGRLFLINVVGIAIGTYVGWNNPINYPG